jgi:hypothetical protein
MYVFVKRISPTAILDVVALLEAGALPNVMLTILAVSVFVTLTFAVVVVRARTVSVDPLNTVLDGTAPNKLFIVIFLDVGVPFGSVTSKSKSGDAAAVADGSCDTFLSAIIQLPILY